MAFLRPMQLKAMVHLRFNKKLFKMDLFDNDTDISWNKQCVFTYIATLLRVS